MPMVRYKYMANMQTIESNIVKNNINQNDVQNIKMIRFMHSFLGGTSWTTDKVSEWQYAKLAEMEE